MAFKETEMKFSAFFNAMRGHSRNEWLEKAAKLEREALLEWLDTTEEGLFERQAEDRLEMLSRPGPNGLKAKVLRRDRRHAVPSEIAAIFSVKFGANGPDRREIGAEKLVPGDVIELVQGEVVPTDVRLLSCDDFHVDQSAFSGNTMPVRKYAGVGEGKDLHDFPNIALRGMRVVKGRALGVVVAGGPVSAKRAVDSTEFGNFSAYGFLVPQR